MTRGSRRDWSLAQEKPGRVMESLRLAVAVDGLKGEGGGGWESEGMKKGGGVQPHSLGQ